MSIIADSLMTQNDCEFEPKRQGMGIATVALIDSTVSVTTRQRDSVPIASEVAMAPNNREEVTGVRLLSKPTAPDNRIIGLNPCTTRRITATHATRASCSDHRQHCGDQRLKMARSGQRLTEWAFMPTIVNLCPRSRANVSGIMR
jgi:hypothetical protein